MKRILALTLAAAMLLGGCGKLIPGRGNAEAAKNDRAAEELAVTAAETTAAPTTEPTTVPTEPPVYRNPVNGQLLDAPFVGRIYATTVSNLRENLPHVGVTQADVVMEMYVNMNNVVRCLALFSDIESVKAMGSTRSTRPIFNQIAQHYDLILGHAGGSSTALADAKDRGIENFNIESWDVMQEVTTSYRDKEYKRSLENSLFGIGAGYKEYAEKQGWPQTLDRDYGFRFTEDGTPASGEDASDITIHLNYKQAKKDTQMIYNTETGKYVWNQYGQEMHDQITDEAESFTNVIVMFADVTNEGIYHYANFNAGGTGYYANGGKIIPIVWGCDGDKSPFHFLTNDAQDLEIGVGNTYIAIVGADSSVDY